MGLHNRINPSESLKTRVLKLGLHAIKLLNDLRNTLSPPSVNKDIKITEISEFDDRANTFWNEIKDHYDFIVERTREHLNWNYCDPRGGNFTVKLAEEEGRMLGYIVLGMDETREYGKGEIIDLLTVPGNLNVADVLLEDANRFYDDNDINSVTSLVVEGHPYEMVFRRHGFLKLRRKMHVFYQCPEKDEAFARLVKGRVDTTEAGKVHLSRGDLI